MFNLLSTWLNTLHLQTIVWSTLTQELPEIRYTGNTPVLFIKSNMFEAKYTNASLPEPVLHIMTIGVDDVFANIQHLMAFMKPSQTILVATQMETILNRQYLSDLCMNICSNIYNFRLIFFNQLQDDIVEVHSYDPIVGISTITLQGFNSETNSTLSGFLCINATRLNFQQRSFNFKLEVDNFNTFNTSIYASENTYSLTGRDVWIAKLIAQRLNASLNICVFPRENIMNSIKDDSPTFVQFVVEKYKTLDKKVRLWTDGSPSFDGFPFKIIFINNRYKV